MLRRLPISLRFDDEDTDFYYGFIEQKKNDRELSSLILDLLHVYHENEEVRNIVNQYIIDKSPYFHIHEQLERIALEHSRQAVSTNMLNDFTDNARKNISEPPEPKEEKSEEKKEVLLLESAMPQIQAIIEQKITEALGKVVLNGLQSQSIVQSVSEDVSKSIKDTVKETPTVEEKSELSIPMGEKKEVEKKKEFKKEEKVVEEEKKPATKKPASFSKLMNSVQSQS